MRGAKSLLFLARQKMPGRIFSESWGERSQPTIANQLYHTSLQIRGIEKKLVGWPICKMP